VGREKKEMLVSLEPQFGNGGGGRGMGNKLLNLYVEKYYKYRTRIIYR
jgi:hypothetical protein